MQGQLDAPLTARGVQQAEVNAAVVAREGIDAMFVSPLGRVIASAAPLVELTGFHPIQEPRLMEWDTGAWSGVLQEELPNKWPEAWKAWTDDPFKNGPPGGETIAQLSARAGAVLADLFTRPEERIAVLAHGFIGRFMLGHVLGHRAMRARNIEMPNDRVHRLTRQDEEWRADHFDAGKGPFPGIKLKSR